MSCFTTDISSEYTAYPADMSVNLKKCLGSDITGGTGEDVTVAFWQTGVCLDLIHDYLYPGPITVDSPNGFSIGNFNNLNIGTGLMLSKYYNGVATPVIAGQIGYHPIQEIIANMCSSSGLEGICNDVLGKLCNGCSRNQIANNLPYTRLCGCYAPDLQIEGVQIAKQCDSLCDKPGYVATLRDTINPPFKKITCTSSNICVITDITFIANGVSFDGSFNITQKCSGCSASNPCKCIIDSTLPDQIRKLGLQSKAKFRNLCSNSDSLCIVRDPATGITTNVDCEDALFSSSAAINDCKKVLNISRNFWYAMIVILILSCIVAINLSYSIV